MAVVAIAADKGGVGKSTAARNVVSEAARQGLRVLAVDADKQADLTQLFDILPEPRRGLHVILDEGPTPNGAEHIVRDVRPRIDLLPSHPNLALADRTLLRRTHREHVLERSLGTVIDEYDLVVVDLGHSDMVAVNVFAMADLLLVPTTTAWLDAMHVRNMLQDAAAIRGELGLPAFDEAGRTVVSVWRRTRHSAIEDGGMKEIETLFKGMLAPHTVPTTAKVQEASYERMSVREYRDERALKKERMALDPVVQAYESLTATVLARLPQKAAA